MKKVLLLVIFIFLTLTTIKSQTITQMGFIIKKAIPSIQNIAIIFPKNMHKQIAKEAKIAQIITKKKYVIYTGEKRTNKISTLVYNIKRLKNVVVIIITDNDTLSVDSVKYLLNKFNERKIPVISNRKKDTLIGVLMTIFKNDNKIEKHINKIVSSALEITFSQEFLNECIIDVE